MTSSYLNPSKKITETLSEFLDFERQDLEIGIWSGDLSLRDVTIRNDALYPLLNNLNGSSGGAAGVSVRRGDGANDDENDYDRDENDDDDDNDDGYDPLRLKLCRGTIGLLRIKIPWKRLVWGQGDVQVTVERIQLELAYESPDETKERIARARRLSRQEEEEEQQHHPSRGPVEEDVSSIMSAAAATVGDGGGDQTAAVAGDLSAVQRKTRERKQERLRQAERLHLQGLPIPNYNHSNNSKGTINGSKTASSAASRVMKMMENYAGEGTSWDGDDIDDNGDDDHGSVNATTGGVDAGTRSEKSTTSRQPTTSTGTLTDTRKAPPPTANKNKKGRFESLIQNFMNSFAWRFFAGLQASIRQVRIVLVQDDVEMGILLHSLEVGAANSGTNGLDTSMTAEITNDSSNTPKTSTETPPNIEGASVARTPATGGTGTTTMPAPVEVVTLRGDHDDGEHVEKKIHISGLGFFLRRMDDPMATHHHHHNHPTAGGLEALRFSSSVSADDFILRPAEIGIDFTFFFPYPAHKQKKAKRKDSTASGAGSVSSSSVVGSVAAGDLPLLSSKDSVSTTDSSKRRRGKREKRPVVVTIEEGESSDDDDDVDQDLDRLPQLRRPSPAPSAHSCHSTLMKPKESKDGMEDDSAPSSQLGVRFRQSSSMNVMGDDDDNENQRRRLSPPPRFPPPLPPRSKMWSRALTESSVSNQGGRNVIGQSMSRSSSVDVTSGSDKFLDVLDPPHRTRSLGMAHQQRASGSGFSGLHSGHSAYMSATMGGASGAIPTLSQQFQSRAAQQRQEQLAPHCDLHFSFGQVKTICGSGHYDLAQLFVASLLRMRNGRPSRTIRSTWNEDIGPDVTREVTIDLDALNIPLNTGSPTGQNKSDLDSVKDEVPAITPTLALESSNGSLPKLPKPQGIKRAATVSVADLVQRRRKSDQDVGQKLRLALKMPVVRSERTEVVRLWWRYAYKNVLREVRKQRKQRNHFAEQYIKFDWDRQSLRRKEYIDLYIQHRLEKPSILHSVEIKALSSARQAEDTLLMIEDELPVEQILLYRSIARALRVRGLNRMPSSIRTLHPGDLKKLAMKESFSGRKVSGTPASRLLYADGEVGLQHIPQSLKDLQKQCESARGREIGKKDKPALIEKRQRSLVKESLNHSDSNKATVGRELFSPANQTAQAITEEKSSNRDREVILSDMRTVRTYRTYKTARSVESASVIKQDPTSRPLRFSLTAELEKFEFMVYKDGNYLRTVAPQTSVHSDSSIHGYGATVERLGPNMQDLIADERSSDGISELSFQSNDVDQDLVDEADDGDQPILSATDFLFFGNPSGVLLHLTISSVSCSFLGESGGKKRSALSVKSIQVTGTRNCHLMSIGVALHDAPSDPFGNPVTEVQLRPRRKPMKRVSLATFEFFNLPNQAIVISSQQLISDDVILDFDMSKVTATVELEAALQLKDFLETSSARIPGHVIGSTESDSTRKLLLEWGNETNDGFMRKLNGVMRLHGAEVFVPCMPLPEEKLFEEKIDLSKPSLDSRPQLKLAVRIIELYQGSRLMEVSHFFNSALRDQLSRFSEGKSVAFMSTGSDSKFSDFETSNHLHLLDVEKALENFSEEVYEHCILSIAGLKMSVEESGTVRRLPIRREFRLNRDDVDLEILFSVTTMSNVNNFNHRYRIATAVSDTRFLISERRIGIVSLFGDHSSALLSPSHSAENTFSNDVGHIRLAFLANVGMLHFDISTYYVGCDILEDDAKVVKQATFVEVEAIMEESIADFLAVIACFDLNFPVNEAISTAQNICVDRLVAVGLTRAAALSCTKAARENFLDDIGLVRKTQTEIIQEFSVALAEDVDDPRQHADGAVFASDAEETSGSKAATLGEEDSIESIELLDAAIRNAVEKTIVGVVNDSLTLSRESGVIASVVMGDGCHVSATKYFYDLFLDVHLGTITFDLHSGIKLLRAGPSGVECDVATRFSFFQVDEGFPMAGGGLPLTALGGRESPRAVHPEALSVCAMGQWEFLVNQATWDEVLQSSSKLSGAITRSQPKAKKSSNVDSRSINRITRLTGKSFRVTLLSGELNPFCCLSVKNFTGGTRSEAGKDASDIEYSLEASDINLMNLTPEGQLYPVVVDALGDNDESTTSASKGRVNLSFFQPVDPWSSCPLLEIEFNAVRVVLLRQFLNEVIQFTHSSKYGIGYLSTKYTSEPVFDTDGKLPLPFRFNVVVKNSSVILPETSISLDMAAIEVESLTISNNYMESSFEMPSSKEHLSKGILSRSRLGHTASMSSGETEFFECVADDTDTLHQEEEGAIHRISVGITNANIFSSLGSERTRSPGKGGISTREALAFNGRAEPFKSVFVERQGSTSRGKILQDDVEAKERFWEKLTTSLISLEVICDYAPHLRLLITDMINDGSKHRSGISLDTRMSQFYLLLSIWYGNMQEMPVMFPYDENEIEHGARYSKPPESFPEYGSKDFVRWLKEASTQQSEICLDVSRMAMLCSFDQETYFGSVPASLSMIPSTHAYSSQTYSTRNNVVLEIALDYPVLHVSSDLHGIMRVGLGASGFRLVDERRELDFQDAFKVTSGPSSRPWADLNFGLEMNGDSLQQDLSQAVQVSSFLTPGWSLTNIGFNQVASTLFDFTPIWILLEFYSSYFSYADFGHPYFEAKEREIALKRKILGSDGSKIESPGLSTDFRLWLRQPYLTIPSSTNEVTSPSLSIACNTGFWYRYKAIGSYYSQEMASTDLSLCFSQRYHLPTLSRKDESIMEGDTKCLISGLSFGLRMDFDSRTNHQDIAVQIPFLERNFTEGSHVCSVVSDDIEILPVVPPEPFVCMPSEQTSRDIGATVCELTPVIETIPIVSKTLTTFLTGAVEEKNEKYRSASEDMSKCSIPKETSDHPVSEPSFFINARIRGLRVFAIDPVLGKHLPIAVANIGLIRATFSQMGKPRVVPLAPRGEAPPGDLHLTLDSQLWVDYFKLGATRSWEPLIEAFGCFILYEKSRRRGHGLSLSSNSPIHFNVTGALLLILDEAVSSIARAVKETFYQEKREKTNKNNRVGRANIENIGGTTIDQRIVRQNVLVKHVVPPPLKAEERVAFSLRNLTGERIRLHQRSFGNQKVEKRATITYLDHGESTQLHFDATVSVSRNLTMVEAPFPGLRRNTEDETKYSIVEHSFDVQIPGFKWLESMTVDSSGRNFDSLVPRSREVLHKVYTDWRLANTMRVLKEVGLENGGRLISVRSLFEIRNMTSHNIRLVLHPDPTHVPSFPPGSEAGSPPAKSEAQLFEELHPQDSYQVPILLLESALQLNGNHLGCMWIAPNDREKNADLYSSLLLGDDSSGTSIGFSSRPMQLAKIVHESSHIFRAHEGNDVPPDQATSGVQVSCPISDDNESVPLAPFCYAVELQRSPLVSIECAQSYSEDKPRVNFATDLADGTRGMTTDTKARIKKKIQPPKDYRHGPVSYSIVVHPPLLIENLLPFGGRFELMHASRRTVLWFADVKPGERIPIHTVGLDAPLLLLVNLGFCRTPVGEGALIHHGAEAKGATVQGGGLKSIGKAVKVGTKQIGKTLTALGDSPDKRGKGLLFAVQNPHLNRSRSARKISRGRDSAPHKSINRPLGLETGDVSMDGVVHVVDSRVYSADDIATETVVVDSIGQRLTLSIENTLGKAGQRRVSLFCPFWIVNTTEHALRYKQDRSSDYVSGTIISTELDGSKPVDSSNRATVPSRRKLRSSRLQRSRRQLVTPFNRKTKTVFAGMPGALAVSSGIPMRSSKQLASLLDKDLPVGTLASLGFMFNFHEGVLSIGHQKLSVQLADGTGGSTYATSWSQGFSLESVGVPQVVGMHCKDGRVLEVAAIISVAPGFLGRYTKIIRFLPRFTLVNRLDMPVRLWQDSSLLHSLYEDRAAQESAAKGSRAGRKWKMKDGRDGPEVVSQYEVLFGKSGIVSDEPAPTILPGTTAHHSALYVATVDRGGLLPFHLPDTRGDRQLRIDIGGNWNLTASFNADVTGEHTLKMTKAVDLRLLTHVDTRASPHYKVTLPPNDPNLSEEWDGELGVWFETDWGGDRKIIVKGTKRSRFAFNHTDIHVGDELLRIDDTNVSQLTFSETMKLLKERLAYVTLVRPTPPSNTKKMSSRRARLIRAASVGGDAQVTLTFRTLEEKLRRLRVKAAQAKSFGIGARNRRSVLAIDDYAGPSTESLQHGQAGTDLNVPESLKVELRSIHNSLFVIVNTQDSDSPPYRIENRAMNYVLFYRQRGCTAHPWNSLSPGETRAYSWEEPMKARKLTVRLGMASPTTKAIEEASMSDGSDSGFDDSEAEEAVARRQRKARLKQILSAQYVDGEEQGGFGASRTVKLEEIGFHDELLCPTIDEDGRKSRLQLQVDTDGATRVLIVSDANSQSDDRTALTKHIAAMHRLIHDEEERSLTFQQMKVSLENQDHSEDGSESNLTVLTKVGDDVLTELEATVEHEAQHIADFPETSTVSARNQIVVEVLEAAGLKSSQVTGYCNPYCEVVLKGRTRRKRKLFSSRRRALHRTYYVEKTMTPKWSNQVFVFDVPAAAAKVTRGHSIRVSVRNFRFVGNHHHLGQTSVHLRNLRNQEEMIGWYPLVGRTGRRELEDTQANWGRGSLKLRVQWIYTVPGLVDYFAMLSERRLLEVRESLAGMRRQLENLVQSEKRHRATKDGVPSFLGIRIPQTKRLQSGYANDDSLDNSRRGTKMLSSISKPLQVSRDRLLYLLYYQAAQSKRNRRQQTTSVGERLIGISEESHELSIADYKDVEESTIKRLSPAPSFEESLASLLDGDVAAVAKCVFDGDGRRRSVSLGDFDFRRDVSQDIIQFSRRARTFSRGEGLFDESGSFIFSENERVPSSSTEQTSRKVLVEDLLKRGKVFHASDQSLFRRHLLIKFRMTLFHDDANDVQFEPKSIQSLSRSNTVFRSWVAAQVLLNDPTIGIRLNDNAIHGKKALLPSDDFESTSLNAQGGLDTCRGLVLEKYRIPVHAPSDMRVKTKARGLSCFTTRNNFERACKRSLRAVLNPGGWLTIRPITVLNLADSYTGMFVRLRYGSEVIVTQTVDAKVVPYWSDEPSGSNGRQTDEEDPYASDLDDDLASRQSVEFEFNDNDLQVYVEPQKTSGSLQLTVVGERLNKKQELGVLQVPLGAAISCCVEAMEEAQMHGVTGTPMYVRWFPLIDPTDAVAVEGDMGFSARPPETEKERDSMFQNYFAPCIRLALIWQPSRQDEDNSRTPEDEALLAAASGQVDETWYREQAKPVTDFYFNADVGLLSAALIDSQRSIELLSLSFTDVDIRYSVTKAKTRTGFVVGWVQIDHQDETSKEPVVFAPTPVEHPDPTLQFLAVKDNRRSKSDIDSYEYIGVSLQEMDLTIEEAWLFDLWEFFISVARRREVKSKIFKTSAKELSRDHTSSFATMQSRPNLNDGSDQFDDMSLFAILFENESSMINQKVYVEQLLLGFIKVNLSYIKGRRQTDWEVTDGGGFVLRGVDGMIAIPDVAITAGGLRINKKQSSEAGHSEILSKWMEHTHDDDLWTDTGTGKTSLNVPNIVATVFPSVSDAPIRLQGKAIEHVFESAAEIFDSIKGYYVNETLKQIYKIIGSLDFVGNPTMVFHSFATGVRDFFVAPSQELMKSKNPSRVGIGVAKGTLSLISHSASGLFGFAAKMSATAGQAAAALSFDDEYKRWHRDMILAEAKGLDRQWRKRGLQSFSAMVTQPIFDILRGILLGTSGLLVSPYKGAKRNGAGGFARGVAVGVVGVFAKPLVGILDAFTHFTGSIHDVARSVNLLEKRFQPAKRLRHPYFFGPRNVLAPFGIEISRSVYLMRIFYLKQKKVSLEWVRRTGLWEEAHICSEILHMEQAVETFAIVTTHRVLLVKVRKQPNGTIVPQLCWELYLCSGCKITSKVQDTGHNGVSLTIMTRTSPPRDLRTPVGSTPNVTFGARLRAAATFESPNSTNIMDTVATPKSEFGTGDDFQPTQALPISSLSDPDAFGSSASTNEVPITPYYGDSESTITPGNEGHFHVASQHDAGDILEWFSVLAEFQHRRQLSRIHNAICCVVGDFDSIITDRGLGLEGTSEGYTVFGLFQFSKESDNRQQEDQREKEQQFSQELEHVPWVHPLTFQELRFVGAQERENRYREERLIWSLAKETEYSWSLGGPRWLVEIRAQAMFVPKDPPTLPRNALARNSVVIDVLRQLESGSISYQDALERILELKENFLSAILLENAADESYDADEVASSDDDATGAMILSRRSRIEDFDAVPMIDEGNESDDSMSLSGFVSQAPSSTTNSPMPPSSLKRGSTASLKRVEPSLQSSVVAKTPSILRTSSHLLGTTPSTQGSDMFVSVDGGMGSLDTISGTNTKLPERSSSTILSTRTPVPDAIITEGSRIDRLERILEKFMEVALYQAQSNQQVMIQQSSTMTTTTTSAIASPIVDENQALRNEVAALRAKVAAKLKKEETAEDLRREISMLREELGVADGTASVASNNTLGRKTGRNVSRGNGGRRRMKSAGNRNRSRSPRRQRTRQRRFRRGRSEESLLSQIKSEEETLTDHASNTENEKGELVTPAKDFTTPASLKPENLTASKDTEPNENGQGNSSIPGERSQSHVLDSLPPPMPPPMPPRTSFASPTQSTTGSQRSAGRRRKRNSMGKTGTVANPARRVSTSLKKFMARRSPTAPIGNDTDADYASEKMQTPVGASPTRIDSSRFTMMTAESHISDNAGPTAHYPFEDSSSIEPTMKTMGITTEDARHRASPTEMTTSGQSNKLENDDDELDAILAAAREVRKFDEASKSLSSSTH